MLPGALPVVDGRLRPSEARGRGVMGRSPDTAPSSAPGAGPVAEQLGQDQGAAALGQAVGGAARPVGRGRRPRGRDVRRPGPAQVQQVVGDQASRAGAVGGGPGVGGVGGQGVGVHGRDLQPGGQGLRGLLGAVADDGQTLGAPRAQPAGGLRQRLGVALGVVVQHGGAGGRLGEDPHGAADALLGEPARASGTRSGSWAAARTRARVSDGTRPPPRLADQPRRPAPVARWLVLRGDRARPHPGAGRRADSRPRPSPPALSADPRTRVGGSAGPVRSGRILP
ncbi:hypothetical protein BJ968_000538 [Kineococcus aurantiacus]|uniref:Uncharacterized protein n=1 Tax=Kineococcus aurantiacus TaxID=37633 RepID=A0A7Y9DJJ6_9ACTN|nr:hypothetical protein [Kineococcus aurantiacus]